MVCPRVAITMEDNDLLFYRIKPLFPQCSTLAIQNGRRDNFAKSSAGGFFELLERQRSSVEFDVTTLAIFGPYVESLYRNALGPSSKATYVHTGSIRNNASNLAPALSHTRIIYVSSFANLGLRNDFTSITAHCLGFWRGCLLTFGDFFKSEALVAVEAAKLAHGLGLPFIILGKRPSWQPSEHEFFAEALSGLPWAFQAADSQASSYSFVAESDIIINIDSTFGYEMFGRGVRVAFVSGRMDAAGLSHVPDCEFGYPHVLESSGPFWTNTTESTEIRRVLHNVISMNAVEWSVATSNLRDQLMAFDFGNQHLCHVLTELGVRTFGSRIWDSAMIPEN